MAKNQSAKNKNSAFDVKKELITLQKEKDKVRSRAHSLFQKIVDEAGLEELVIGRSSEYDDNNYYTLIRPYSVFGVELSMYAIEEVDLKEFKYVVNAIIENKLEASDVSDIMEALDIEDLFEYNEEEMVALALAIANKKVDSNKVLDALLVLNDYFGENDIPDGYIQDVEGG